MLAPGVGGFAPKAPYAGIQSGFSLSRGRRSYYGRIAQALAGVAITVTSAPIAMAGSAGASMVKASPAASTVSERRAPRKIAVVTLPGQVIAPSRAAAPG